MESVYPTISRDGVIQGRYEAMRAEGQSHSIAEILATRSFPGVRTDATFLRGHVNGSQFQDRPGLGDTYRAVAESEGLNTTGKVYLSGLAAYPGDPRAWVTGRGDVERVCRERGWACDGAVQVAASTYLDAKPEISVAPDIIESEVERLLEIDPHQRVDDVRERVTELRTGEVESPLIVSPIPEGAIGPN
jgi:hypothetical protein